jgi:hypothetical protein
MWGIQRTSTLPVEACLVLYSFVEDGNTAPSLFLECGISPYIPQWIIAEHLSFPEWVDTHLPLSVLWQSCDMYCNRFCEIQGALLSEPLLSIFLPIQEIISGKVCLNSPHFRGTHHWTMNFLTENGSRLKCMWHFVPISCRPPHMHPPPHVQSFVYHSQCSVSWAENVLPLLQPWVKSIVVALPSAGESVPFIVFMWNWMLCVTRIQVSVQMCFSCHKLWFTLFWTLHRKLKHKTLNLLNRSNMKITRARISMTCHIFILASFHMCN